MEANDGGRGMQGVVFALVAGTFMTVYIPQPVLPILTREFGVTPGVASLTVSATVFGIALANLPFGVLADRFSIRPLVLGGGAVVALASIACALTHRMGLLIAARFLQGLFIPSMSTCLAAYLSRTLPPQRLTVVMGWYVSATVTGGLGGRLLGGFVFPPEHWRYAFVAAAALVLAAGIAALRLLPRDPPHARSPAEVEGFLALLRRPELLRMFAVGFFAFAVFSAMFNYVPFYLSGGPLHASVRVITLLYLGYVVGIAAGPISGTLAARFGTGLTIVLGCAVFGAAIALTLVPSLAVIAASLAGICGGFFAMHAGAVGAMNRRLTGSRGRANSLYVLLYYLGGAAGISVAGAAFSRWGWAGAAAFGGAALTVPLSIGIVEAVHDRERRRSPGPPQCGEPFGAAKLHMPTRAP
ncbi:MAG TPA: MFS transporter [Myxococcales bacterium]|nr:MFS transporter [Myxococcales bacterium]